MRGTDEIQALGGMMEAAITPAGTAERIENLRLDPEGFWSVMPGTVQVTALAANDGAITSLYWFNPRPNQRWLVLERVIDVETSTLEYVNLHTQATVEILTHRRAASGDAGTVFAEHARWLYMFGPVNPPRRWNGYWTSPVGFTSRPPAPEVAGPNEGFKTPAGFYFFDAASGVYGTNFKDAGQRGVGPYPATKDQNWRYAYGVTVLNELAQESPMSVLAYASGTNDSANGKALVRVRIPRMPEWVRAVRLWRSVNIFDVDSSISEVRVQFVEEFSTGALIDYIDLASDSELGLPFDADSTGPIPIGARCGAFWQGRLWLGGAPADPTRLNYSAPLFPEQFPEINYLVIGSGRSGAIVALHVSPRGLVVFKEHGVYLVVLTPDGQPQVLTITEEIGCAAPRAIESVRGLGLVFLASSGPHILRGTDSEDQAAGVVPIEGIRRTWRRYVARRLATAVSVYDPDFQEVWFHVPRGGNLRPTLGLVFHVPLGQWSLRTGWPIQSFARHLERTWIGSGDDDTVDSVGVHVLTAGSSSVLGGEDVTGLYRGARVTERRELLHTVEPWVLALGSEALTVTVQVDRGVPMVQTEIGKEQQPNTRELEAWGTATWDDTRSWEDWDPARLQVHTRMTLGDELLWTVEGRRFRLFSVLLVVAPKAEQPRREGRP